MTPIILALALLSFAAQDAPHAMPPGMSHEEHLRQMQKDADLARRGAAAMGFDQESTVHHFRLAADGGAIEVTTKAAGDDGARQAIRTHLREIAEAFASGDFAKPLATHGELPPGVPVMQTQRSSIAYAFEEIPDGGRVRVSTSDATALAAIHEFLRYQIREHHTGDPVNP